MKHYTKISKICVFVFLAALCLLSLVRAESQRRDFTFQKNVMIPMRDGLKLAGNIFLPKGDGPFPAILMRTPYGKFGPNSGMGKRYSKSGYVLVIQDCRGRGDSEGIWDPFRYDVADGYDTQEWIGRQSWSNGKIGCAGGSYVGWTQWASAPQASKYLMAMVPVVPFTNVYHDIAYPGGAYQLALCMGWGSAVGGIQIPPPKVNEALRFLPLKKWDDQFDREVFYLENWVTHPTYDDYWKKRGIDGRFSAVTVPILNIGGWYDIFSKATIEMVDRVRHESENRLVRRNQFAIMGPWGHGVGGRKTGQLDFGEKAKLNIQEIQFKWFEYWLKEKDTGVEDWPPYSFFVMGENKWRGENEWPLKRTRFTKYYLHSQGKANSRNGDGLLSDTPPESEKADSFIYDPADPVPTNGGNNLIGAAAGPFDQSKVEERKDVLVYTGEPLQEALEVTGPVRLSLYAASTAKDTDFTAKLVDVHPDGKAYNLCEGIIRARYRKSFTKPEIIEPGKIYQYEIDLWVTSNFFKSGHRIRVEISSSNFPRFDRNPNSGQPFGADTKLLKATQTICHDKEHPSYIVLPVIPR